MIQKKKGTILTKRNAIKKSKKVSIECPQCRDSQFPVKICMEEELLKGVITGFSCPKCAFHVDT